MNLPVLALLIAGLGWGTTGLFVRLLGHEGLSVYELLSVRLIVAGFVIAPILAFDLFKTKRVVEWKAAFFIGLMMVFYYLGAITAFRNLQLIVAALIIGSSPLLAWLTPLLIERRAPKPGGEVKQGLGVLLAMAGLGLLIASRDVASANSNLTPHTTEPWLGYFGAVTAAIVTVFNARFLNRKGNLAPKPFEITIATVLIGLFVSPFLISDFPHVFEISRVNIGLILGFGILATAVPGIAIAYASVRLPPQATATVSIQLQVWAGVLAWIFVNESMTPSQILAAFLIVAGSWICVHFRSL